MTVGWCYFSYHLAFKPLKDSKTTLSYSDPALILLIFIERLQSPSFKDSTSIKSFTTTSRGTEDPTSHKCRG